MAWGVVPVACTRFCERPELPHVGGTKDPDLAEIIAVAPRPRRHVRGGEPAARTTTSWWRPASTRSRSTSTGSDDVAPQLAALAEVVGVRFAGFELPPARPAPPYAGRSCRSGAGPG